MDSLPARCIKRRDEFAAGVRGRDGTLLRSWRTRETARMQAPIYMFAYLPRKNPTWHIGLPAVTPFCLSRG